MRNCRWRVRIKHFRLFDKNYDGYIDKKEFKWMTTSDRISNRTIDIVFSVRVESEFQPTDPVLSRGVTRMGTGSSTIRSSNL